MAMVQSKITAAETQSKNMKIFAETFSRLFSASLDFAEILQQYGLRINAISEELVRSPMPVERRVSFLPQEIGSAGTADGGRCTRCRHSEANCGGDVDTAIWC